MIVHIRGVLIEKGPTRAVIEAGGIGYELFIPLSTYDKLPRIGEETKLSCHHVVREDDEALFGFATFDEKNLFIKLTSVSGVGPKIAIAILSGSSVSELAMSIAGGDSKRLSAIKGVGKKTAEKICVELRDKVSHLAVGSVTGDSSVKPGVVDAIAALRSLGYSEEESSKKVADTIASHPEADTTEKIIRLALANR